MGALLRPQHTPGAVLRAQESNPEADVIAPVWPDGTTLDAGTKTDTTVALSASAAATDAVGVTGYEWSSDNGSSYPFTSLTPAFTFTALTALTSKQFRVRAYDAAGNRSAPLSLTTSTYRAGATGQVIRDTTGPIGGNPAGILYNDVVLPGDAAKWFSLRITVPPATNPPGWSIDPQGRVIWTGGEDSFTYMLEVDGVDIGTALATLDYSGSVVSVAATGAMSWAGTAAVDVTVGALASVTASVAATGAMSWAGTAAVDVTVGAPASVTASVAATGAMSWAGTAAVDVTVGALASVTASVAATGAMSWAGTAAISIGEFVWPASIPVSKTSVVASPGSLVPAGACQTKKTAFMQRPADVEFYAIDFAATYLSDVIDTAANLLAFSCEANAEGFVATPKVAIGEPVPGGVLALRATGGERQKDYKITARIGTDNGREKEWEVTLMVREL